MILAKSNELTDGLPQNHCFVKWLGSTKLLVADAKSQFYADFLYRKEALKLLKKNAQ